MGTELRVPTDGLNLTPLQLSVWCSTALRHEFDRGRFGHGAHPVSSDEIAAAVAHFDKSVADQLAAEGITAAQLALAALRHRFVVELDAPEANVAHNETRLMACIVNARFWAAGGEALDLLD